MNDPLNLPEDKENIEMIFGTSCTEEWFNPILKKAKESGIDGRTTQTSWEELFHTLFFTPNMPFYTYYKKWDEDYLDRATSQIYAVIKADWPDMKDKCAVGSYIMRVLIEGE